MSQAAARRGFEVAESFLGTLLGHRALDEDFWRNSRGWDVCPWIGWGIRTSSISGGLGFNNFVYKWSEISLINVVKL